MTQQPSYKKPIIYLIGFLCFVLSGNAQDIKYVEELFATNDLTHAKEAVDSFVTANDKNANGWLLKAKIYYAISKDPYSDGLVADPKMDAYEALQNAVNLKPSEIENELKSSEYKLPIDLYHGYTEDGIGFFNAGVENNDKANFSEALNKFKKAGVISKFIYSKGWGLSATDTCNLFYAASSAIHADKEDDALLFSKRIADANIVQSKCCTGFEKIYQWLSFFYKTKKDETRFLSYTQKSITDFPESEYFCLILIDWYRQKKDFDNLFANYKKLFKNNSTDVKCQFAYLNDIFNYLYRDNENIANRSSYETELEQGLTKLIQTNPEDEEGNLLAGKFYYNRAHDVAKSSQPISQKNNLETQNNKKSQIHYLENSNKCLKQVTPKSGENNFSMASQLIKTNNQYLKILQR